MFLRILDGENEKKPGSLQRSGLKIMDLFSFSYTKHSNQNAGTDYKRRTQDYAEYGGLAEHNAGAFNTVKILIAGTIGLWYT